MTRVKGRQRGGFQTGGGFPIWTCPSSFVLFCPFWDFPDFSGIFPICSGMVRGFSRFVPFLFLGLIRAPTRNSAERVRDTIWTFPEKSGKPPGLETPRFSFSQKGACCFLSKDLFLVCSAAGPAWSGQPRRSWASGGHPFMFVSIHPINLHLARREKTLSTSNFRLPLFENPYRTPPTHRVQNPSPPTATKEKIKKTLKSSRIP